MRSSAEISLADILALPPVDQLDAVLRAARLPVDPRSRTILSNGFIRIRHERARWEPARQQPDPGKAFGEIFEAVDSLLKDDGRRHAVSIMESGTVWRAPIHSPSKMLTELRDTAQFYYQLYTYKEKTRKPSAEYDLWVYYQLYNLFGEIKGTRPGNTYLLYNFTIKCAELLGIKLGFITAGAFRMRIARMLAEQRKGFGSMGAIVRDLPPVRIDQLFGGQLATLGTEAFIGQDDR